MYMLYKCSTNFVVQDYKFHLFGVDEFKTFADTVLGYIYNLTKTLTFGEREYAEANGVDIDLGGEHILRDQNLVVDVIHSKKESNLVNDPTRRNIFYNQTKQTLTKFKELDKKKRLDIYILFTNYKVPALQEEKLVNYFTDAKNVGAKIVIIVGKETLSQWLGDSRELKMKVICQYPHDHIRDLIDCLKALQSIKLLEQYREDVKTVSDGFEDAKKIVESNKGLVFIIKPPESDKTTIAKELFVKLSEEYSFIDITFASQFDDYWIPDEKQVFLIDNIDIDGVKEWSKLEDKLKIAIKKGSKFVFSGKSEVLKDNVVQVFEDCKMIVRFHP